MSTIRKATTSIRKSRPGMHSGQRGGGAQPPPRVLCGRASRVIPRASDAGGGRPDSGRIRSRATVRERRAASANCRAGRTVPRSVGWNAVRRVGGDFGAACLYGAAERSGGRRGGRFRRLCGRFVPSQMQHPLRHCALPAKGENHGAVAERLAGAEVESVG